jgi:predicted SAM-dependent methyltransferase
LLIVGILQGISALLLTFDESEVRKIVAICQHVLNHLSYIEMLETMEQLVDFVKVSMKEILSDFFN